MIDLSQGSGHLLKKDGKARTTYRFLSYICSQMEGVIALCQKHKGGGPEVTSDAGRKTFPQHYNKITKKTWHPEGVPTSDHHYCLDRKGVPVSCHCL